MRIESGNGLPAVLKPGPTPSFSALPLDGWLEDPVIPTTQQTLSRGELILAVRDQDGGAHSASSVIARFQDIDSRMVAGHLR
jgi:hypothetical protein